MNNMSELWRAKCVKTDKTYWNLEDVIFADELGVVRCIGKGFVSENNYKTFEDWARQMIYSKWELIQPNQPTLTPEEVIELLIEITGSEEVANCKKFFGNSLFDTYDILDGFTPYEIIQKLTDYKKSKQVKVISKQEYDKVASDKLDEMYPGGWQLE